MWLWVDRLEMFTVSDCGVSCLKIVLDGTSCPVAVWPQRFVCVCLCVLMSLHTLQHMHLSEHILVQLPAWMLTLTYVCTNGHLWVFLSWKGAVRSLSTVTEKRVTGHVTLFTKQRCGSEREKKKVVKTHSSACSLGVGWNMTSPFAHPGEKKRYNAHHGWRYSLVVRYRCMQCNYTGRFNVHAG